jgi:hypothetical protein
VRTRVDDIARI